MNRRVHGAPAQALCDALAALSGLAFWVAWTADADLPPEPSVSARAIRDAAAALRRAARLLDEAADRAEPPSNGPEASGGQGARLPAPPRPAPLRTGRFPVSMPDGEPT